MDRSTRPGKDSATYGGAEPWANHDLRRSQEFATFWLLRPSANYLRPRQLHH